MKYSHLYWTVLSNQKKKKKKEFQQIYYGMARPYLLIKTLFNLKTLQGVNALCRNPYPFKSKATVTRNRKNCKEL